MTKTITSIFKTRRATEEALYQLELIGITQDKIGLIVSDETRGKIFNLENHTKSDLGLATGATFGGIIGGILAMIAGAGTIVIPGLSLVIAGEIVAGLAGLGAGATLGGLIGGLIGLGVPEHEAKLYHEKFHAGHIMLAIEAANHQEEKQIRDILGRSNACDIAA